MKLFLIVLLYNRENFGVIIEVWKESFVFLFIR